MQMVKEKQDLTYLSWSVYLNSSGTAGTFLKAYSELGGKKTYYKLSNFDKARGVIGHECVNELIVDRLLTILGIQTFMIVAGVIKMIPLTGVTMPFLSYGGSSLVASFGAVGVLGALKRR